MKQIVIIHGGSSFANDHDYLEYLKNMDLDYERLKYKQKWKPWIAEQLQDGDVLLPSFPCLDNAKFDEWKISFEKILPYLENDVILVGHSLGAMFLAKYLQENPLDEKVDKLILISGRYSSDINDVGSFALTDTTNIAKSANEIHLFHSEDDAVVPFEDIYKFSKDTPSAILHTFSDRGHFNGETFPELLDLMKQ